MKRFHPLKHSLGTHGENGASNGACRIYLVRHGRTIMNVQIRFRGRLEVPLDEKGREEAWLAADNLAEAGLTAVYTSPLGRAREVAQAISSVTGVPVEDHDGFLNLDYGEWEGLTKEECAERHPDAWRCYRESPERAVCPGGERLRSAADRVVEALREIGRHHPGEAVAAVSHGVMVRLALLRVAPQPGDWEVALATGSATVFDVADGTVALTSAPGMTERVKELARGPRGTIVIPASPATYAEPA